jgi:hypothetical protein
LPIDQASAVYPCDSDSYGHRLAGRNAAGFL